MGASASSTSFCSEAKESHVSHSFVNTLQVHTKLFHPEFLVSVWHWYDAAVEASEQLKENDYRVAQFVYSSSACSPEVGKYILLPSKTYLTYLSHFHKGYLKMQENLKSIPYRSQSTPFLLNISNF